MLNALDQVRREVATRYDFKGAHVSLELTKTEIVLEADDEYCANGGQGPDSVEGGPSQPVAQDLRLGQAGANTAARCASTSGSSASVTSDQAKELRQLARSATGEAGHPGRCRARVGQELG